MSPEVNECRERGADKWIELPIRNQFQPSRPKRRGVLWGGAPAQLNPDARQPENGDKNETEGAH